MEVKQDEILKISSRQELRQWFVSNGLSEKCCWVVVSMREKANTLLYLDVVEEALCFGWIDSTRKKMPDGTLIQRLSRRLKNGNWTELNKERVRRLEYLGLMTDEGRKFLPEDMDVSQFTIHPTIMLALKSDPAVYKNFVSFPSLYQRVRIDTIQSRLKRKEPEIFKRRLEKFLTCTRENKMYGEWNDNGRLLNYKDIGTNPLGTGPPL